ncbi:hypothetical protein [Paenibacillus sp. CCS19]|uniref:hypothetical protein n=1 Tax=Paenibacillus sp. CCS19 TaxID=3158387 RepID=UPI00295F5800|nr:hypothetical protein [Paenibacillus cellulosilyticus]
MKKAPRARGAFFVVSCFGSYGLVPVRSSLSRYGCERVYWAGGQMFGLLTVAVALMYLFYDEKAPILSE